jgi:hypothetical protein
MVAFAAEDPAEVRVPEASEDRRVWVAVAVGESVVAAVIARPPERSVLHRRAAQPRQRKLEAASRLEGVMREIAMVAGRDSEQLEQEAGERETEETRGEAHERGGQAERVDAPDDARGPDIDQSRAECC